ncbi:tetratricopeptide repeat protein [Bradyrhizobium sp.]|uniref:tetratricopeptide repeat protein n=1 Tax=Bradyrhizobium sp. TaxID=376 RepID=UPI003C40046D
MNRRERRAAVQKSKAAADRADSPATLHRTGMQHLQAGRHLDAQLCCQQVLAVDPNHADTLHLMGLLSLQAEQHNLAVEWIARAIRCDPQAQYLLSLGTALQRQGRLEEALKAFGKAAQLKPDAAGPWQHLGAALVELKRPGDALLAFQQLLELDPGNWDAADKCASLFLQLGRLEEAVGYFGLCDQMQPGRVATVKMRALALFGQRRFEESLAETRRAHALDPADADICNNLGVVLRRLDREEESLPWFDRALELRPNSPAVFTNKAFALTQLHRFSEALSLYDASDAIDPGNPDVEWSRALLHLLMGNFEAGWAGREARWQASGLSMTNFKFSEPLWLGKQSVAGKTILIHVDEGFGDTIQFARYVPMVAALGARVILIVSDALQPLLSELSGVSECHPLSTDKLLAFDTYCPISSLPLAFDTRLETIPAAASYLPMPTKSRLQAWEDRLGPHDRLRVGMVWSGNPKHKDDHNRSLALRILSPLLQLDASFVSLQKELRPGDMATLRESGIVDLTAGLTDFVETAALVCCLDLVITVDTSVAHLAAALGRPTWILLPYKPDYRWLLDRDDSPWYPTVRLFRQTMTREYASVVERVRAELSARIAAWSERTG